MADCSEISLMLSPFEDGELEPHEMQEVARHLSRCKNCEQLLEEYGALGRELRSFASQSQISLEGFAERVDERLRGMRVPWSERLGLMFGGWSWQIRTAFASTALVATAAIVTIMVVTPLARVYFGSQAPANHVAMVASNSPKQQLASAKQPVSDTPDSSEAVISRLESSTPSVALWSAPRDGTTVIWLPEPSQRQ